MKLKNREKVWIYNIVIALVSFAQKTMYHLGSLFPKIWQNLKHFSGQFHQESASYF